MLYVFTDNSNMLFAIELSKRAQRWKLAIEQYGIVLNFLEGKNNHVVDTLSHLCYLTIHDKHFSFDLEIISLNQKSDEHLKKLISNNKTIQKNV